MESPAYFVDTILGISWVDIEARVDVDVVEQFCLLFILRSDLLTAVKPTLFQLWIVTVSLAHSHRLAGSVLPILSCRPIQ